jgi:hypothetical protein
MRNLDAIVIPTGTHEQDLERVRKALEVGGNNMNYIVSGMGPSTNEALVDSNGRIRRYNPSERLDFHHELWRYFLNKHDNGEFIPGINILGLDTKSLNSRENLMYTFPEGTSGSYGIVSYPLHLFRLWALEKILKKKGEMSKDVELVYISTKSFFGQTPREVIYEIPALIKNLVREIMPQKNVETDSSKGI